MTTIFVHRDGRTEQATSFDRGWLNPSAGVLVWVDLAAPSIPESLILSDTFGFHPLSVEDAMSMRQYPKVESYDGYLYAILHELELHPGTAAHATHDVDFFVGANYLVTVHDGDSQAIVDLRDHAVRNPRIVGEGPVVLLHRVVDAMVDRYRPEMEKFDDRLDALERSIFERSSPTLVRDILAAKRDVSSLRRVITPQRDVVVRLARREFMDMSVEMSFRFRDVYDHLVRVADDTLILHDRITGLLDAHLSNVNNRLNEIMKVLTVVATIFMPLTLLTGVFGMNVPFPRFPGGDGVQFWWLSGIMATVVGVMLLVFRRQRWI